MTTQDAYTWQEARDLYKDSANITTAHGWTFELRRDQIRFSRTEGRGQRGKKVNVGRVALLLGTHGAEYTIPLVDVYTFIARMLDVREKGEIALLVERYHDAVMAGAPDLPERLHPRLSWELERGIDVIDHGRPPFKGAGPGFSWECSTVTFMICEKGVNEITTIPHPSLSKVKQAQALYAELERMGEAARARMTRAELFAAIKRSGAMSHTYHASN